MPRAAARLLVILVIFVFQLLPIQLSPVAQAYGVSTTPTVVIVGRDGLVTTYHPGVMTLDALEAAVLPLLAASVPD